MVPCKLFGSMGVGRPTIFIGHPDSELARVLIEHDCGYNIRQGDVDGLVNALTRLKEDAQLRRRMGDNARRAMKEVYDRDTSCEQWRVLLEDVVARRPAGATTQQTPAVPQAASAA